MESGKRLYQILLGSTLACLLLRATTAHAQQVVAPMNPPPPVAEKQAEAAATDSTPSLSATAPAPKGFRVGPLNLRPHFFYRYLYGDGLRSASGDQKKSAIQSISPGLYAELGSHVNFDYTPTWNYYSSRAFRDTVDQSAFINWSTQYQDWNLAASQNYSQTDSPMIETGRQTKTTAYVSTFDALYAMGSRYAVETTLIQNLQFTEDFNNPRKWSVREVLRQKTTPQVDSGLGVEYDYTAIKRMADIGAYQLFASLSWRPVKQLNLAVQGGLEKRHIYSNPSSESTGPVYSGSIQFIPTNVTQIGISASRSTSASFLENQLSETTQYGLNFNQRLLGRFQLAATYSHSDSDYSSTKPGLFVNRQDKTDTASLNLSTTLLARVRIALTYLYTNNASNISGFKFTSNQVGFEIGYSF